MIRESGFIICLIACPIGALAQELTLAEDQIRTCFETAPFGEPAASCIGQSANQCQVLPGGSTTSGIGTCLNLETAVWDKILNEEYGEVRIFFGEIGGDDLQVSLRDAQRAWITFRDAECGMQYQRWIGGTIRSVVGANCTLHMTASRAIALRDMKDGLP